MKIVTIYECEICGSRHDTEADAAECEAQGIEHVPGLEVGDIVLARAGFGWFDGDVRWIENYDRIGRKVSPFDRPKKNQSHGNCFGACCTYQFYYVVTAIDRVEPYKEHDGHRVRYHLATLAMSESTGYGSGWTYARHHVTPTKVAAPPQHVVDTSKALIGREARTLI